MAKRLVDCLIASVAIVVMAPLFVGIAVVIKVATRGPVFFRQARIGRYGNTFEIIKFRTMVPNAAALGPHLTVRDDQRVTGVGRLLRRYKLDELPQLFNVVVGDMSLVGPRPELPRYVQFYDDRQRRVLSVRPGMTDYASLAYRNENALLANAADAERLYLDEILPAKLELCLAYLDRAGLWEDLRILLQTIRAVWIERVDSIPPRPPVQSPESERHA